MEPYNSRSGIWNVSLEFTGPATGTPFLTTPVGMIAVMTSYLLTSRNRDGVGIRPSTEVDVYRFLVDFLDGGSVIAGRFEPGLNLGTGDIVVDSTNVDIEITATGFFLSPDGGQ